ncbi:MAG: DUF4384 domain-containing protein [Verrucomicrobiae bacterium]|nr:DUF4384 domain-containing protein [Verrucomicrobiae bacterium]
MKTRYLGFRFGLVVLLLWQVSDVRSDEKGGAPSKKALVPVANEPAEPAKPVVTIADNENFKATTNTTSFKDGEGMAITITAKAEGYIRIYGFNDDGDTVQVFPNEWEQDNRVTGGGVLKVPADGASEDYDLFVSVPEGRREVEEFIQIIFSPEPFNDSDIGSFARGEGFRSVGKTTKSLRLSKGLRAEAVSKVSEKTISYEVSR